MIDDTGSSSTSSHLAGRLKAWSEADAEDAEPIALTRDDASRLLDVAEKAHVLLVNAFAMPADEHGVRLKSEDAVRLQWALRQIGVGDDASDPAVPFSV